MSKLEKFKVKISRIVMLAMLSSNSHDHAKALQDIGELCEKEK